MNLVKVNLEELTQEEYRSMKRLCVYINKEHDQEIFLLQDEDKIHTVFVLEHVYTDKKTVEEVFFHTDIKSQGKGYTLIGFKLLFDYMKEREDIEKISIASYNPIAVDVAYQNDLIYEDDWTYKFYNPSYVLERKK